MRVVLTGGGTGGHIFPLIAVAKEIRELANQKGIQTIEFLYIGPAFDSKSEEIFRREGIEAKYVLTGKLRRYFSSLTFFDFLKIPIGVVQALWILFKFMPEIVFSKGGYGSFPAMFASWLYRIPVRMIHESDAVSGLANRITSHFATKIGVAFPSAALKFPIKKTALVGNPTRGDLCDQDMNISQKFFNIGSNRKVLLVMGGSQGAESINNAILAVLQSLLEKYEVIHIAGDRNYEAVKQNSEPLLTQDSKKHYHLYAFLTEEMKFAYSIADAVVSRAGAGTIFELAACKKPSILIPLKNSAQNHQAHNAYAYVKSGGAIVIEEDNLTPHILLERIYSILDNEENRNKMSTNAASFATKDSSKVIAREILKSLGVI
ncbi:undecaprenyldiphospho-muramoylpentapeptide beta-N-acetylglucosaminyltransferase [Candidatus Azambacteria bacterium]|nr:undecaprenyldiphospho-muramoylpentapeptide beta-N-acetylglucosaminyltransferase [Candidatus Azambacteria bacterium]